MWSSFTTNWDSCNQKPKKGFRQKSNTRKGRKKQRKRKQYIIAIYADVSSSE